LQTNKGNVPDMWTDHQTKPYPIEELFAAKTLINQGYWEQQILTLMYLLYSVLRCCRK